MLILQHVKQIIGHCFILLNIIFVIQHAKFMCNTIMKLQISVPQNTSTYIQCIQLENTGCIVAKVDGVTDSEVIFMQGHRINTRTAVNCTIKHIK